MSVEDYEAPTFVNEGQKVIAPYDDQGRGIWCVVVTAAGTSALVANKKRAFLEWLSIDDLRIPKRGNNDD
jgi:hypothetical protein